jgi:hypothetical protein
MTRGENMRKFYLKISEAVSRQFKDYQNWTMEEDSSSKHWTRKIKAAMVAANRKPKFELRFTDGKNGKRVNWEFVYDFVFLDTGKPVVGDGYFHEGNFINKVVAVVESEFNPNSNGILYDFAKLLLARSTLRIMVFYHHSNEKSQEVIDAMIKMIVSCKQSEKKDLYLICQFDRGLGNFRYHLIDGTGKLRETWT